MLPFTSACIRTTDATKPLLSSQQIIHAAKFPSNGLDAEADYIDLDTKEIYHGDELMEIGLVVDLHGDYQSRMWKFSRLSREGEQQWQY